MLDIKAIREAAVKAAAEAKHDAVGAVINVVLSEVSEALFLQSYKFTAPASAAVANLASLIAQDAKRAKGVEP